MSLPPPSGDRESDPMPVVARSGTGIPTWAFVVVAGFAALLLFGVLDARRRGAEAPSVAARPIDTQDIGTSLPPLALPIEPAPTELPPAFPSQNAPVRLQAAPLPAQSLPRALASTSSAPIAQTPYTPTPPRPADTNLRPVSSGSAVVVDNSAAPDTGNNRNPNIAGGAATTTGGGRVRASMLANRTTTVPQGTLIQAVLETGFDSTRAGYARASVSRNIMGFDGQRVLIPRGSRLIGEYQSDTRAGQNRALIIWNRLIRPDGATIEIASPAADTVGRGGIKADVNNHFFQRFSGAILQSALNAGVNIASQRAGGTTVVTLPYGGVSGPTTIQPNNIQPTLKVKPGTSISVFVARDLDFTDVEQQP